VAGRKPSRAGEKKSDLTAADVMALLAPLPAHLVPAAVDAKTGAAFASRSAKPVSNAVDGVAPKAIAAARPDDAATVAAASTDVDAGQAAEAAAAAQDDAKDTKTTARSAAASDVAFKDALAQSAPAQAASEAPAAATHATVQPAVGMPAPAVASASSSTQPAASADKATVPATADKTTPAPELPTTDGVKVAATSEPAGVSPLDASSESSPQTLPQLQSIAAPTIERSNAAAPSTPVLSVAPPVGSTDWGPAIGHQMVRMSASGHQVAELNLNPAGLGPLKVTLTMGDNQAQAMFVSAHESVRKAVEAALPQLRATLAEQGISLGQTSVGAETRQPFGQGAAFAQQNPSRSPNQPEYQASGRPETPAAPSSPALPSRPLPRAGAGLDTFA
jgi:flagellar hook-length control protein FliK